MIMFAGFRSILIVLAGLVILGASPPKWQDAIREHPQTQREITETLKSIDTSLKKAVEPDITTTPCRSGEDHRESDLCAQWKAADAAKIAAVAAWIIGGLGVLVGGATLVAAIQAAKYAKKAADHTEIGAKAAIDSAKETATANKIARELARPWITIGCKLTRCQIYNGTLLIDGEILFKNIGDTPAAAFANFHSAHLLHDNLGGEIFDFYHKARSVTDDTLGISLLPGEEMVEYFTWDLDLEDKNFINEDGVRSTQVFISATAQYRSATKTPAGPLQTARTFRFKRQGARGNWSNKLPDINMSVEPEKMGV
ncbi:MAG: hypothetical protein IT550_15010, partial [Novosphingobium sp.]|nr:hypothetical protein [Novosphingobium sp.]